MVESLRQDLDEMEKSIRGSLILCPYCKGKYPPDGLNGHIDEQHGRLIDLFKPESGRANPPPSPRACDGVLHGGEKPFTGMIHDPQGHRPSFRVEGWIRRLGGTAVRHRGEFIMDRPMSCMGDEPLGDKVRLVTDDGFSADIMPGQYTDIHPGSYDPEKLRKICVSFITADPRPRRGRSGRDAQ